jgi:hydroxyethylthiazole kinase-like sugar kinase family protein
MLTRAAGASLQLICRLANCLCGMGGLPILSAAIGTIATTTNVGASLALEIGTLDAH